MMYRDFARRKARSLDLAGIVENLQDGTVHVIAQGEEVKLEQYLSLLKRGSFFSRVDAVDEKWSNTEQAFNDFQIKYSSLPDRL